MSDGQGEHDVRRGAARAKSEAADDNLQGQSQRPARVERGPARDLVASRLEPRVEPPREWLAPAPKQPPTINVTIGRVEVKAAPASSPAVAPPPQPRAEQPVMSLEEYLRERAVEGGR